MNFYLPVLVLHETVVGIIVLVVFWGVMLFGLVNGFWHIT